MSRSNWFVTLFALIVFAFTVAHGDNEKILRFFWDRARATVANGNPDMRGLSYSFIGTTCYRKYAEKGKFESSDSTRIAYFFSFGKLDSSRTLLAPKNPIPPVDFTYPNVFDSSYVLNFYPNDTGGQNIGIGFDSDSAHSTWPVGLVLLDRQRYFPVWLYFSYPAKKGYRRFSRAVRFTQSEGFIFPDSVSEVATVDGLFFSTSYRLETGVKDLKIYRK